MTNGGWKVLRRARCAVVIAGVALASCKDDERGRCEHDAAPVFQTAIVDPAVVKFVTMPGTLGGGGSVVVGRSYVIIEESALADEARVPLVAPADMELIGYAHYLDPNRPTAEAQWVLQFRVSCEIEITLAHLNDVPERILARVEGEPQIGSVTQEMRPPIAFAEGETIGWKFHQDEYGVDSFDLIFQNSTVENQFVNQERYYHPHPMEILTETCAFPYFAPAIRDAYLAKMGTHGTGLLGQGTCRDASRDVAGTLAGSWYWNEDASIDVFDVREGNYPNKIAVIDDQGQYVAVANLGPRIQQSRTYANEATYRLPESVTDRHCYQFGGDHAEGFADFQLLSPTSVRVVYEPTGSCPVVFDGTRGRTYYR